jgi:hypothetical protein
MTDLRDSTLRWTLASKQIADQRRAIVTKNLSTKPWLEEIRAQVAETLKETTVKENDQDSEKNINTDEETTQPISKNEQKKSKVENADRLWKIHSWIK